MQEHKSCIDTQPRSIKFYVDIKLDKFYVDIKNIDLGPSRLIFFILNYKVHKCI